MRTSPFCRNVLAITCKLPSTEAAAGVKSIDFTASEAIFNSGKSLTITLTEVGDADEDGILHLFATLPMGTTNVPAGTELMVRFNAPETEHTVYSRFLTMGAATFAPNKANTLNVNAEQSDKHAGKVYNAGGFVGEITKSFTMTKCSALADITVNSNYVGGFAGTISTASGATTTLSKCWSTGKVTSSTAQCGGFIGHIAANAAGNVNVSDCYETGNLVETNQRQGGFIGQINSGNVTLSRCYSAGTVTGSFAVGGLVSFMNTAATIQNCAAWNSSVTPTSYGSANWSTGAIIGAWPIGTYTDNYRKPAMSLTAYWVPAADYDHPDVSATNPLTDSTGAAMSDTSTASGQAHYPQYPYHGKHVASGKTLSQLASTTLGWSSDVWDFTGDLPTLK